MTTKTWILPAVIVLLIAALLVFDQLTSVKSYNVKSSPYNAVGDGVVNDTAAIQRAINDACVHGKSEVYIPTGIYAVTYLTVAPKCRHIKLRGDGYVGAAYVDGRSAIVTPWPGR